MKMIYYIHYIIISLLYDAGLVTDTSTIFCTKSIYIDEISYFMHLHQFSECNFMISKRIHITYVIDRREILKDYMNMN